MTILERLYRAKSDLETILSALSSVTEPVACIGQGRLEVALYAVGETTELLIGNGTPELDMER